MFAMLKVQHTGQLPVSCDEHREAVLITTQQSPVYHVLISPGSRVGYSRMLSDRKHELAMMRTGSERVD